MTAIEPCRARFDGCDAMRAEDIRKHPRTPRLAECQHMPIPPERPERLRGPLVGAICVYQSQYEPGPTLVRVIERSYVWAPGDASYGGGSRRYDWSVVAWPSGRTLVVDDSTLTVFA